VNDRRRDGNRDFVRDVLARTSGSACDRACGLLPDLTDGQLEATDRQLVQQHLEHCAPCRNVAVAMGWLGSELPSLAVLEPGPEFTAAVLGRTSGQTEAAQERRRARLAHSGPGGLMHRFGSWWQDRILQPGFAMQAAYAATVILVLLTSTPISPFRGAPRKALESVQAGPESIPLVGSASGWIAARADSTITSARRDLDGTLERTGNSLGERATRTAPARDQLGTHLVGAGRNLKSGRMGEAGAEILAVLKAGREVWKQWWMTIPETNG